MCIGFSYVESIKLLILWRKLLNIMKLKRQFQLRWIDVCISFIFIFSWLFTVPLDCITFPENLDVLQPAFCLKSISHHWLSSWCSLWIRVWGLSYFLNFTTSNFSLTVCPTVAKLFPPIFQWSWRPAYYHVTQHDLCIIPIIRLDVKVISKLEFGAVFYTEAKRIWNYLHIS